MPDVLRLYFRHCLIGFGIAALFVAMLLVCDVQNLWTLIRGSDVGLLATFMLWFFNGIVFAGVQFGIHVMSMAEPLDKGRRGEGPPIGRADLVAVPAAGRRGAAGDHRDRAVL